MTAPKHATSAPRHKFGFRIGSNTNTSNQWLVNSKILLANIEVDPGFGKQVLLASNQVHTHTCTRICTYKHMCQKLRWPNEASQAMADWDTTY